MEPSTYLVFGEFITWLEWTFGEKVAARNQAVSGFYDGGFTAATSSTSRKSG